MKDFQCHLEDVGMGWGRGGPDSGYLSTLASTLKRLYLIVYSSFNPDDSIQFKNIARSGNLNSEEIFKNTVQILFNSELVTDRLTSRKFYGGT